MFDARETITSRWSWTQPMCAKCYAIAEPYRAPFRTAVSTAAVDHVETCCTCGKKTADGIYYRIDPASVAFPTRTK